MSTLCFYLSYFLITFSCSVLVIHSGRFLSTRILNYCIWCSVLAKTRFIKMFGFLKIEDSYCSVLRCYFDIVIKRLITQSVLNYLIFMIRARGQEFEQPLIELRDLDRKQIQDVV